MRAMSSTRTYFRLWGRASLRSAGMSNFMHAAATSIIPIATGASGRVWMSLRRSQLKIPPARFVQWKAVLHSGDPAPRVDDVLLNYLPKNVAPEIDEIVVQPGYRYQPIPHATGGEASLSRAIAIPMRRLPAVRDRESVAIRWSAHDDNDDQLVYTIYYRGDGESRWLLLKNNLADRFYSFDSSLLPDGGYIVKMIASDAPSHSPGDALYAERVSDRFEVDTTSPVIEGLTASLDGKRIHVRFHAADSFSPIKRAEYSLDGGDWQFVEPVGQLSDSKMEDYDFHLPIPQVDLSLTLPSMAESAAYDHVVVVRVYDRYDNLATAKTLLRGK